jgi:[CysO sulfur-carrier protein]-S-L-cysteine hydrolase
MIEIPSDVVDEIREQAMAETPNEACGYLAGRGGRVKSRIQMTNVDASPEHFSFEPSEQFDAMKTARTDGLELIAVYHSHPETPARMSDEDIRLANDTRITYVIMSLSDNRTKAFRIHDDKTVHEVPLRIVSDASVDRGNG